MTLTPEAETLLQVLSIVGLLTMFGLGFYLGRRWDDGDDL